MLYDFILTKIMVHHIGHPISEVFFHNGLHGLYGFLSLGGSCHSDCSASGHRRPLRREIRNPQSVVKIHPKFELLYLKVKIYHRKTT